jgi:hypothetical protein
VSLTENNKYQFYSRVITKLPNSEQSNKGKVKTHKYINRQNQSTNQTNNNPTNQVQGNITLTGVNLSATDGDINLTANNNVNIKAALETTTTNSSELHGKADIKFVVKNEYAQIKPAIEALIVCLFA